MGDSAGAMNKILQAVQLIQQAGLSLPAGSPLHREALKAATSLSKHLPQGAPTQGVQLTGIRDLMRQIMSGGFLQHILAQRHGGAPGGPAGPAPPMPSTPLPGA